MSIVENISICRYHCFTVKLFIHITNVLCLILSIAMIPTKVFPAPQGNTIIPDLALFPVNILEIACSWYTLILFNPLGRWSQVNRQPGFLIRI